MKKKRNEKEKGEEHNEARRMVVIENVTSISWWESSPYRHCERRMAHHKKDGTVKVYGTMRISYVKVFLRLEQSAPDSTTAWRRGRQRWWLSGSHYVGGQCAARVVRCRAVLVVPVIQ